MPMIINMAVSSATAKSLNLNHRQYFCIYGTLLCMCIYCILILTILSYSMNVFRVTSDMGNANVL